MMENLNVKWDVNQLFKWNVKREYKTNMEYWMECKTEYKMGYETKMVSMLIGECGLECKVAR